MAKKSNHQVGALKMPRVEMVAVKISAMDPVDDYRVAFTLAADGRRLTMPRRSVYFKPGHVMMSATFARKIGAITDETRNHNH